MKAEEADEAIEVVHAYKKEEVTKPQVLARLFEIFKEDFTREQALKILDACSPYQVTGHDTPSDVEAFLNDFEALRGKVSKPAVPVSGMGEFFCRTSECGRLATHVNSLLYPTRTPGRGEEIVAFRGIHFQKLWDLLQEFGDKGKQLNYLYTKTEKSTNEWKLFFPPRRPDKIVLVRGKVCLYGEEKEKAEDFFLAVAELTNKVMRLPAAMYGKLKFVICYAAAGSSIQFFTLKLRKLDCKPVLTPVTKVLDVVTDAPQLVLVHIKLYFLLLGMGAAVGNTLPYSLGTFESHGYSRIKLTVDGAEKEIPDFDSYAAEFGVRFQDLEAAYKAAQLCSGHMITSVLGPKLESREVEVKRKVIEKVEEASPSPKSRSSSSKEEVEEASPSPTSANKRRSSSSTSASMSKKCRTTVTQSEYKVSKQVYKVRTRPLCAEKVPECEEELREMAYGVLRGLKALHDAGLVHRDIRFPNIMYDYLKEKYLLIDLESVAPHGEVQVCQLRDWIGGTLDSEDRYTKLSDLHQLGDLLQRAEVAEVSKAFEEFTGLLLSKTSGTSADTLLQHPWMLQVSGDQTAVAQPR